MPLYLVVLVAFGTGIIFAALFYATKMLSARFAFGRKENELTRTKKELAQLTRENHQLELTITRLKAQNGEGEDDEDSL